MRESGDLLKRCLLLVPAKYGEPAVLVQEIGCGNLRVAAVFYFAAKRAEHPPCSAPCHCAASDRLGMTPAGDTWLFWKATDFLLGGM